MIQIEVLALVLTGIGIMASILYYASVLRNANKTQRMQLETRKTQLYMQLFMRTTSEEFMKLSIELLRWEFDGYDELNEKYLRNPDINVSAKWFSLIRHIDGLGYMMARELIEAEMVYNLGGGSAQIRHWMRWEPVIMEMRRVRGEPEFLEWFEYLVKEMMRLRQEKGLEPIPQY